MRRRITPLEASIPIHSRLAIIQVESLDTNILGSRVEGVEVTPFLNELKRRHVLPGQRLTTSVRWTRTSCSSMASLDRRTEIPICSRTIRTRTPRRNCWPIGFRSTAFHGNSGEFYGRRSPFEKAGFDAIYFREDLDRDYDLRSSGMGIVDSDVFRISAEQFSTAKGPTCHFIITLTTHFHIWACCRQNRKSIQSAKHDRALYQQYALYRQLPAKYVEELGSDTTLFLYADHPSEGFPGYASDRDDTAKPIRALHDF